MKRTILLLSALLGLLAGLSFGLLQPARAAGESVNLTVWGCDEEGVKGTIKMTLDAMAYKVRTVIANDEKETGVESVSHRSGPGTFEDSFVIALPDQTELDDRLTVTVEISQGGTVVAASTTRVACSGIAPPYIPAVQPLAPELAAPYLAIPGPAGVRPCGVFDVNGWGIKFAALAGWPACAPLAPKLTVACLNGQAQWVADNVHALAIRADGREMRWESTQHGICAFFPASASPAVYGAQPTPTP